MASLSTLVGFAGSVAVASFALNGSVAAGPTRSTTARPGTTAPLAKARVVRVTGEDFKFDAPATIPAGLTEFRFLNKGPAIHHMAILKLEDGKTFDDLKTAIANPGPPPAWIVELGGPNAPSPGVESNATISLDPGNYALICFVDIGGAPHFMKGMVKALQVVAEPGAVAPAPRADAIATLFDYNFRISAPIRAGTRTIRVVNEAKQHHEVELVQLAPGASVNDFMKWMDKMDGPPPGKALGGIAGLAPGMSQTFSADFTPGTYALICFLPDSKDGKPHFVHGMIQQIEVK
jgi:uncharacterized cupredoxin-like copper-binding protein